MSDLPAILGGTPAFENKIHNIVRPVMPEYAEMSEGVQSILRSGMVTKGDHLKAFEKAVREHLGVKHAIGVSSCTSGLMLTYRGLGLTGDVVVPSFTFMATVSALVWSGLRPVSRMLTLERPIWTQPRLKQQSLRKPAQSSPFTTLATQPSWTRCGM